MKMPKELPTHHEPHGVTYVASKPNWEQKRQKN